MAESVKSAFSAFKFPRPAPVPPSGSNGSARRNLFPFTHRKGLSETSLPEGKDIIYDHYAVLRARAAKAGQSTSVLPQATQAATPPDADDFQFKSVVKRGWVGLQRDSLKNFSWTPKVWMVLEDRALHACVKEDHLPAYTIPLNSVIRLERPDTRKSCFAISSNTTTWYLIFKDPTSFDEWFNTIRVRCPLLHISHPTGFQHTLHVTYDPAAGEITGLPDQWIETLASWGVRSTPVQQTFGDLTSPQPSAGSSSSSTYYTATTPVELEGTIKTAATQGSGSEIWSVGTGSDGAQTHADAETMASNLANASTSTLQQGSSPTTKAMSSSSSAARRGSVRRSLPPIPQDRPLQFPYVPPPPPLPPPPPSPFFQPQSPSHPSHPYPPRPLPITRSNSTSATLPSKTHGNDVYLLSTSGTTVTTTTSSTPTSASTSSPITPPPPPSTYAHSGKTSGSTGSGQSQTHFQLHFQSPMPSHDHAPPPPPPRPPMQQQPQSNLLSRTATQETAWSSQSSGEDASISTRNAGAGGVAGRHSIMAPSLGTSIDAFRKSPQVFRDIKARDLTGHVQPSHLLPSNRDENCDIWKGEWSGDFGKRKVDIHIIRMTPLTPSSHIPTLKSIILEEIRALHQLRHAHVVRIRGFVSDEDDRYGWGPLPGIVETWIPCGNVVDWLEHKRPVVGKIERLRLLTEAAAGLNYLHSFSREIIHGNFRGMHILLNERNVAYVSGYGINPILSEMEFDPYAASAEISPAPRWASIEAFAKGRKALTAASDVWSFARTVLEVLTGRHPFEYVTDDADVISFILRNVLPRRPHVFSTPSLISNTKQQDSLWAFLERCWAEDPTKRPTMALVLMRMEEALENARRLGDDNAAVPAPKTMSG